MNYDRVDWTEDEMTARFGASKAARRAWNYVQDVIKREDFQQRIKALRQELGIPDELYKQEKLLIPPNGWDGGLPGMERMMRALEKVCDDYNLFPGDWMNTLAIYLYYGEVRSYQGKNDRSLCIVENVRESKEDPMSASWIESEDRHFPIAIRISPYATKNEVLDFVECAWVTIDFEQAKYRDQAVAIPPVRRRRTSERDAFIYQNKEKPRKEIVRLVAEQFGDDLELSHIAAIISNERKRREKK